MEVHKLVTTGVLKYESNFEWTVPTVKRCVSLLILENFKIDPFLIPKI